MTRTEWGSIMELEAQLVLRNIIARHGRGLLENRPRCESCIRDTTLAKREINALVAALELGIPQQITARAPGSLTPAALSDFAAHLSDESGLDSDLAQQSVAAWAGALEVPAEMPPRQEKRRGDTPPPRELDLSMPADPETRAALPARTNLGNGLAAALLAVYGMAVVLGQVNFLIAVSIYFYLIGCACLLVAAALVRQPALGRWLGLGLGAFLIGNGIFAFNFVLGVHELMSPVAAVLIAFGFFAGVACILILLVVLVVRPFQGRPRDGGSWEHEHALSSVLLAASLWGAWALSVSVGNVLFTEEASQAIYRKEYIDLVGMVSGPAWFWSWIKFPIDLALSWVAWVGAAGWKPGLRRGLAMMLCVASAMAGAVDLGTWLTGEFAQYATLQGVAPEGISIVLSIAMAWFLWREGVRKPGPRIENRTAG